MCQQIIKLGSGDLAKYYRLEDMILHIFFNSLHEEDVRRFFREFECDEYGRKV